MFEENIGVNRSRNSEERLYNGKKKNDKMIYKILHGKLRLRNMNPPNKNWGGARVPEGLVVPALDSTD